MRKRHEPDDGAWKRSGSRLFDLPAQVEARREVEFHIAMKTEALIAEGWPPEKARAEAERVFGDPRAVEVELSEITGRARRSVRWTQRIEALVQDARFGARMLIRRPTFTLVAVLTLALGIGANVAVFNVIESVLLAPLPYPGQDRIVAIWEMGASGGNNWVAEPNLLEWQSQARSFRSIAAFRGPWNESILGVGDPLRRPISVVTGEFFDVMGTSPVIGRIPPADEVGPGAPPMAVVSHAFWSTVLNGERDLSAVRLTILGYAVAVTAVLPESFDFPLGTDIWLPRYPDAGGTRTSHNYRAVGRLAPGVSLDAARGEMSVIAARQMRDNAGDIDLTGVRLVPLAEDLYGEFRSPLMLLLFAASAVLLVACINLASALLARSAAREREVAVRASLGAGRMRLARQLLTESMLLALLGGVLGLALAVAALRVLQSVQPAGVLRMRDMSLGGPIIGFTIGIAVLSSVLFGLIPALRTSDFDVAGLLRGGDRGGTSGHSRLWDVLVAGEVALALVLLVNSALLVRSFRQILQPETGFDARGVVTVNAFIPSAVYEDDGAIAGLEDRLVDEFRRLPDVEAVGFSNMLPGLALNGGVHLDGKESEGYTEYRVADAGFFGALRIPLLAGRLFEPTDVMGAPTVALVDKAFADQFYPGENPIGRRIRNLRNDAFRYGEDDWLTIIGVVGSVVPHGQSSGATPTTYVYYRQRPFRAREPMFTFRQRTPAPQLAAQVRDVMTRVAPSVPFEIGSAAESLEAPLAARRFAMFVIAAFGLLTLVLAAVGIHAVVSWSVQRRTREMGVRIALGAVPRGVARRVVRDAMLVVAIGVGAGILATISTAGLIRGFLVGVGATEPLVLVAMIGVLGFVALVASALPALRVTRIDPVTALRSD